MICTVAQNDPRLFEVFLDRRTLPVGDEQEHLFLESLRKADVLIVLVSNATNQSAYVQKQISLFLSDAARRGSRKPIISLILEPEVQLPENLGPHQFIDLTNIDVEDRFALRALGHAVWGTVHLPERFAADSADFAGDTQRHGELGSQLQEMWESGQIGISPTALSELINLGIVKSSANCAYKEFDG